MGEIEMLGWVACAAVQVLLLTRLSYWLWPFVLLALIFCCWRIVVHRANRSCVFCRIVAGSAPSQQIEVGNAKYRAFKDIAPIGRVHLLIIPSAHSHRDVRDVRSVAM